MPSPQSLGRSNVHSDFEVKSDYRRQVSGALMNNQHTFTISPYPIREWLDPLVTTAAVLQFWQINEYVNGEFRQLWGPFDSKMAAAQAVNRLAAYFNRKDMAWSH